MSFGVELHCPLGDAEGASFIKAAIALLSAMDDMTADWHDEGADRAADVMRRKAMLCHGHSPPELRLADRHIAIAPFQEKDRDRYGRIVAICRVSGEDLGAIMAREGLAWAFVRYSGDYADPEARAKTDRLGIHAHGCQPAWEWRAQQR
jgi:hypothetical protein